MILSSSTGRVGQCLTKYKFCLQMFTTLTPVVNVENIHILILHTFYPDFCKTENGSVYLRKVEYGKQRENTKMWRKNTEIWRKYL